MKEAPVVSQNSKEGSHPFPSLSLYRSTEIIKDVSHFYHINCSVLQEFSALKKPRTTREKKTHMFMFMNELQSLHLSQTKIVCGHF